MKQSKKQWFSAARPVWLEGLELEKNIHAGFRAVFETDKTASVVLCLTGATIYRVFLNGEFVHFGPARGPHGFFRVDELDLSAKVVEGRNLLAIEVVGCNSPSYAYLDQPSFLQAELMIDGIIVAATGGGGFHTLHLPERIQKVERYSFQRPFVEAYVLVPGWNDWSAKPDAFFDPVDGMIQVEKLFLPRRVVFPEFACIDAKPVGSSGFVSYGEKAVDRSAYWWMKEPFYSSLCSFSTDGFERDVLQIYQSCDCSAAKGRGRWTIHDLGVNLTGFVRLEVSCRGPVRLMAVFDEVLIADDIDLKRNKTLNLVYYELQPGEYVLESIEPYTFRYLKLIEIDGVAEVKTIGIREYANPEASRATFECSDPDLVKLFEAGRQTFRQNAVDIYMDCPGRERAGWLCDSFFTGRAEAMLCEGSTVEFNFLENYQLPESFNGIPAGMLPMCYPSEHPNGRYIPQWAMWLVLELEEYLERTVDRELIDRFALKVFALLDYLQRFENADGLLEKLPSWNFIEWSKANELTEDVNYPTNMLYARMLEAVARLYGREALAEKATRIHQTVREQSFNGTFFVDNSIRGEDGKLHASGESTEVCQYYAFFCGTASLVSFPELWSILLNHFGPNRDLNGTYGFVHPANAFIGYYLRMDLLSHEGESVRLLEELKGYFLPMAEATGTLWEHNDTRASCNHGFASFICVLLARHAATS